MAYDTRTISQIDIKNIKIGKTFKYSLGNDSNYNLTNIYYIENNNNNNNNDNDNSNGKTILPKELESTKQDSIDDKTKLILQTPLLYIPNSVIYFNEKPFLELSFNNEDNDKDVLEFKNWITNLEDYIFKLMKKRTKLGIDKSNLCSILKNSKYSYYNKSTKLIVPINMNVSKCILNDDNSKSKSLSKFLFNWEIPVPTYGLSIIWVKNVWVKNGKWGINLFMYASRVMNSHILDPIDFMGIDSGTSKNSNSNSNKTIKLNDVNKYFNKDEKTSIQVGQLPEYTMFFKMLKLGIPKEAVKQKILLLGLETKIIDYPEATPYLTVLHYISNPQLGDYIINSQSNSSSSEKTIDTNNPTNPLLSIIRPNIQLDLLKNISGGFKLKKTIINDNSTSNDNPSSNIKNNIKINNNNNLKVPSLSDITGALSRLKKINLDNISEA